MCVFKLKHKVLNNTACCYTIFFYMPATNMNDFPREGRCRRLQRRSEKDQFFIWERHQRNGERERARGRHTKLSSMLEHSRKESTSRGLISCCWSAASMLSGHPAASRLRAAWRQQEVDKLKVQTTLWEILTHILLTSSGVLFNLFRLNDVSHRLCTYQAGDQHRVAVISLRGGATQLD